MNTLHNFGELYPNQPENGQRRYVLTTLHKECGGQVLPAIAYTTPTGETVALSYKTGGLKMDGSLGCCLCGQQPLTESDTYEDYC